jgi:hypothetical protein
MIETVAAVILMCGNFYVQFLSAEFVLRLRCGLNKTIDVDVANAVRCAAINDYREIKHRIDRVYNGVRTAPSCRN